MTHPPIAAGRIPDRAPRHTSGDTRRRDCTASLAVLLIAVSMLGACRKQAEAPPVPAPAQTAKPAPATALQTPVPVELKDVIETDQRYVVGITYPPAANKYPGLAEELRRYADAARADLMKEIATVDAAKQPSPYELSLNFALLTESRQVVAVAADGSLYTGGAHSAPLVARFVWLPEQNRALRADDLLADPRGWPAISEYVREQLHAALSQRIDADELVATERAEVMRSAGRMIDDGTQPQAASFAAFEPVQAADGSGLIALRFVFPPYQVGPYVDGVRTVEVPAALLMPYLKPEYRALFVATQTAGVDSGG